MTGTALPLFPNSTQLPRRVPVQRWWLARAATLLGMLGLIAALLVAPETGLRLLWGVVIPALPIVWLVAPGLWRNACPLAAANQLPRVGGFTRGGTAPAWWSTWSYAIAMTAFISLVVGRKLLFNDGATASALLLLAVLSAAFTGGWLLKGKSGWCSSICPLLVVQRVYGQAPVVTSPNAHCQPCVGCTRNCYDFNPGVAQLADLHEDDEHHVALRRLFGAAFPGLVLGFFLVPDAGALGNVEVISRVGVFLAASIGIHYVLDAFLPLSRTALNALFGAIAITLFYFHGLPRTADAITALVGVGVPDAAVMVLQIGVAVVAGVWLVRAWQREHAFDREQEQRSSARVGNLAAVQRHAARASDEPAVRVDPEGTTIQATSGQSVLDVVEKAGCQIESGCRMGVCGADPVAVLDGMANLGEVTADEASTLDRLGHADNTRMACVAKVLGPVTVALQPQAGGADTVRPADGTFDAEVRQLVIVGNGIAGVTAADHARRVHPDCEIHLIGREAHPLYNRMGISKALYGRTAMAGLYLQPEQWYADKQITTWLNTRVDAVDLDAGAVRLGTGETLPFDRLVLACGGHSFVPPIEGWGRPGCFVLREADDATGLRSFVQDHRAHRAVVAGGGLLGLEAAYALGRLGMRVQVLELGQRLLRRQLDAHAAELLQRHLVGLGIEVRVESSVVGVAGDDRVTHVRLADGESLEADVLLVAAGVRANVDLATGAGLDVGRGIVVDATLRTADPRVFAVGDAAQHDGTVTGLWPASVAQGGLAGRNAVTAAAPEVYAPAVPVTMLKVVGVDLLSLGRFEQEPGDTVVIERDDDRHTYAKLVVDEAGTVAGGLLYGRPDLAPSLTEAVKEAHVVTDRLTDLQSSLADGLA